MRQNRGLFLRWLRFNFVGLIGIVVQMVALGILAATGVPYLLATAIAVEAAVVHNFLWHERYTWADRHADVFPTRIMRLLCFNASNGLVSLAGNLALMHLLVGRLKVPILPANGVAIVACSGINFLLGDVLVFRPPARQ